MTPQAAHRARPVAAIRTEEEVLQFGREVVSAEAQALVDLVEKLDRSFFRAVDLIFKLNGNLIVTGMGKAGHIGQKLVATFASTGTRAHYLHPAEAFHGDLGRLHPYDVVLVLSQSGETSEVVQMLPSFDEMGVPVIAVCENRNLMRNDLAALPWAPGQFHRVRNYWEAVGVLAAMRAGIEPMAVRRPLRQTSVSKFKAAHVVAAQGTFSDD